MMSQYDSQKYFPENDLSLANVEHHMCMGKLELEIPEYRT